MLIFLELGFIYDLQFRQTKNSKLAKNVHNLKIRSKLSVQKYQFYDDFYRYLNIQIPFSRMRVEGKRLNDTLRPTPIFRFKVALLKMEPQEKKCKIIWCRL